MARCSRTLYGSGREGHGVGDSEGVVTVIVIRDIVVVIIVAARREGVSRGSGRMLL